MCLFAKTSAVLGTDQPRINLYVAEAVDSNNDRAPMNGHSLRGDLASTADAIRVGKQRLTSMMESLTNEIQSANAR